MTLHVRICEDAADLIDELTFQSYAYNRRFSPHLSVESWRRIFGSQTDLLEARFQLEEARRRADQEPVA